MRVSLLAVAAVLALPGAALPGARAAANVSFGCGLDAVEVPVTPDAAAGVLYGGPWRSAVPTRAVTITCRLVVNGATVQVSPTGSGIGTASTSAVASFRAGDLDVVTVCTDVTDGGTPMTRCFDAAQTVLNGQTYYHLAPPQM